MAGIGGPKKPPNIEGRRPAAVPESKESSTPVASRPPVSSRVDGPALRAFGQAQSGKHSGQGELSELRAQLGNESLDREALRGLTTQLLAEHLMILLANKRAKQSRSAVLAEIGDLIIGLDQKERVSKLLALMPQVGRIVDIYPLEVLAYILGKAPSLLSKHEFQSFVRNRDALLSSTFEVGHPIELKVPLALKLRAFALDGGGNPGYVLAPGPPAAYFIEFGVPGSYPVLLRGEIRGRSLIDRLILEIRGPDGVSALA